MTLPRINVVDTGIGRLLLFATNDLLSMTLYLTGGWEELTLKVASLLLDRAPRGGTIIDAGANLGAFTIPTAKQAGSGYRVLSFEPQRIVYYQLCGNIVLNGLENVVARHAGLSDRPGSALLPAINYGSERNIGAVCLDPEIRALRTGVAEWTQTDRSPLSTEAVELLRLDDFGLTDIRLMKLDVEGMELAVLRGAECSLAASGHPALLFEVWPDTWSEALTARRTELLSYVAGLGYDIQLIGELAIAQHRSHPTRIAFSGSIGEGQLRFQVVPTVTA